MPGDPDLRLRIDAPASRLTLRAPVNPSVRLPRNDLANVQLALTVEGGHHYVDISTTDESLIVDGYAMLCAIADRIQLDHVEPLHALTDTLATWRSILARRARMTPEAEVGLFGELMTVEALVATGESSLAWRGGLKEEHDFGLPGIDFEVKTTTGERRQHWIHGLRQLVQTGSTPLWFVSIQITRGGSEQGRTLPELIDSVQAKAPDEDSRRHISKLTAAAGWRQEQRDLFVESWRLRSRPLGLRVDDHFPSITPAQLIKAKVDVGAIRQVAYEIDVTDRPSSPHFPAALTAILEQVEIPGD